MSSCSVGTIHAALVPARIADKTMIVVTIVQLSRRRLRLCQFPSSNVACILSLIFDESRGILAIGTPGRLAKGKKDLKSFTAEGWAVTIGLREQQICEEGDVGCSGARAAICISCCTLNSDRCPSYCGTVTSRITVGGGTTKISFPGGEEFSDTMPAAMAWPRFGNAPKLLLLPEQHGET